MQYTVNDMTAYGIYNGFRENDPDMKAYLEKELAILRRLDLSGYLTVAERVIRTLNKDSQIKSEAMAYYIPQPICDDWLEDYKDLYRSNMANKTAPGVCDVPNDIVAKWVHRAAETCLTDYLDGLEKSYRKVIADAEQQLDIPTREAAKQWEQSYNNAMNEGGYGFVPHVISQEEYDHAKLVLSELETYRVGGKGE